MNVPGLTKGKAAKCTVTRTVVYDDASAVLRAPSLRRAITWRRLAVGTGLRRDRRLQRLDSYARSIAKRAPQVTVAAGDSTYGHPIVVSGRVPAPAARRPGHPWRLHGPRTRAPWHTVAHGKTSSKGTFSLARKATVSGKYRVLVAGSWWYLSGASDARHVAGQARSLCLLRVDVRAAQALRGPDRHCRPGRKGLLVTRQVRSHGKWVTKATTHTTSKGTFRFSVTPPSKGPTPIASGSR